MSMLTDRIEFQKRINILCPGSKDKTARDRYITVLIRTSRCYRCCEEEDCKNPNQSLLYCLKSILECRMNRSTVEPRTLIDKARLSDEQIACFLHDPCLSLAHMLLNGSDASFKTNMNWFVSEIKKSPSSIILPPEDIKRVRDQIINEDKLTKTIDLRKITLFAQYCMQILNRHMISISTANMKHVLSFLGSYVVVPIVVGPHTFCVIKFIKPAIKTWSWNIPKFITSTLIAPGGWMATLGFPALMAWAYSIYAFLPHAFKLYFDTYYQKQFHDAWEEARTKYHQSSPSIDSICSFAAFKYVKDLIVSIVWHNPGFYLSQFALRSIAMAKGFDAHELNAHLNAVQIDLAKKYEKMPKDDKNLLYDIPRILYNGIAENAQDYINIFSQVATHIVAVNQISTNLHAQISQILEDVQIQQVINIFRSRVPDIVFDPKNESDKNANDYGKRLKTFMEFKINVEGTNAFVNASLNNTNQMMKSGINTGIDMFEAGQNTVKYLEVAVDVLKKAKTAKDTANILLDSPVNTATVALWNSLPLDVRKSFRKSAKIAIADKPRDIHDDFLENLQRGDSLLESLKKAVERKHEVDVSQPKLPNAANARLLERAEWPAYRRACKLQQLR